MNASVIVVILIVVFLVLWCSSKKDKFEYPENTSPACQGVYAGVYAYCMSMCKDGDNCAERCAVITYDDTYSQGPAYWTSFLPSGWQKCIPSQQ